MGERAPSVEAARRLALFVFFSGACALLYQVVWQREFRLIFGSSTAASGAVLAAFIGGLGAGSLLLARRVERSAKPFRVYALLELGIAFTTALTPLLLDGVRASYVALGGTQALGGLFGTSLRVMLSMLVVSVPTFLMGGTLPALARAVTDELDSGRERVALLYGVNTLGAVVGSAIATFLLLELLGNRATLWVGCLLNLTVALIVLYRSRALPALPLTDVPSVATSEAGETVPKSLVLGAAFIVGAVFFMMELVWFRMLGPLLGGSVFTFGLVLCVALAGIGLGGAFAGRLSRTRPATIAAFAMTCLLEAAAMALPLAIGDGIASFALALRPLAAQGLAGSAASWTLISLVVVFPAAFVSGVQFPLLISLAGRARQQVAQHVGQVYAANTIGSVVGSLAGGFGLLPWLSAPGVWRLGVGALLALGLGSLALAIRRSPGTRVVVSAAIAALTVLCLLAIGPTPVWRHTAIGAGRVNPEVLLPGSYDAWVRNVRRETVWEADGVEVSVALNGGDGLAFVISGKADGNALGDAATQVMSGLLGALLHPSAKKALIVGLGTGSTAGWLAMVPGITRVDVMEMEPAILEVARRMPEVNQDVMSNPKVQITLGDARELLATSREKYDIIFSEPSNPYRAGIANLYTLESYQAAKAHLEPGGLFIQFLQSYEVDGEVVQSAYATLRSVFGSVETWNGGLGDLLLVASEAPLPLDVARLRAAIGQEPFAGALRAAWGVDSAEGVFAHYAAGPEFSKWIVEQVHPEINTDDLNRMEFGFARSVGQRVHQTGDLQSLASHFYRGRPAVPDGLDASLLRLETWMFQSGGRSRGGTHNVPPREFTRLEAGTARAMAAFGRGDLQTVAREWPANAPVRTSYERLVRLAASFRAPAAERAAETDALRPLFPLDVEAIEALSAVLASNEELALRHLEKAFVAHRSIPWTHSNLLRRALTLAAAPGRSPAWYQRLATALSKPFAASALNSARLDAYLKVVALTGDGEACAAGYEGLGDGVFWTREHLGVRLACFEALRPHLADGARTDWNRFLAQQPRMVSTGIEAFVAPASPRVDRFETEGDVADDRVAAPP